MTQISKNTKQRIEFEDDNEVLIVDVELGTAETPHIWFTAKNRWGARLYARHIRKLIAWLQAVLKEMEDLCT